MYRKDIEVLRGWKDTPNKKALLITGARQIGKTYLVREFAKEYKSFIEINFIANQRAIQIFEGDLDANTIL